MGEGGEDKTNKGVKGGITNTEGLGEYHMVQDNFAFCQIHFK